MGILSENSIVGASKAPPDHYEYKIDNSLKFNDDDSAYLSRTPTSTGNTSTWTWSGWIKRGNTNTYGTLMEATDGSGSESITIRDNEDPSIIRGIYWTSPASSGGYMSVVPLLRDPAGWFHFILTRDGATVAAYINGVSAPIIIHSAFSSGGTFNTQVEHRVGLKTANNTALDGYLAEVNFIDGQALTPSDFGEADEDYGDWKPKAYTGTHGTNGFYLDFKLSAATTSGLGNDASSNSNNWTPNNLAASDQMLDSPTNNFATWNSVNTTSGCALTQGNLGASVPNSADCTFSTLTMTSGKWYFESVSTSANNFLGTIADPTINSMLTSTGLLNRSSAWAYRSDGNKQTGNGATSWGNTFTTGDIISTAVDMDAEKVWWAKNGVWQQSGDPANGTNEAYSGFSAATNGVAAAHGQFSGTTSQIINFGQDSSFAGNKTAQGNQDSNSIGDFYYAPPSGFLALCSKNLPDPTVIPSEHFNTVLYTGTNLTQSITGVGFQPDFMWFKNRTGTQGHALIDSVRGHLYSLYSNDSNTEYTATQGNDITSIDTDGFSVGPVQNAGSVNISGGSIVSWNWKGGGAAVSNTSGSITSSVSANVDAGFSIMTYTGTGSNATIGHGLSKAPEMWVVKPRTNVNDNQWFVCHPGLDATNPATKFIHFDTTAAVQDNALMWNDTMPTSTTISLGSKPGTNNSGGSFVAYAFHSVDGYSKFGSYTGNGLPDGTFVHTGFRPAYVMCRGTAAAGWHIFDNKRANPYNQISVRIEADGTAAENTAGSPNIDFLSNGFKFRTSFGNINLSGGTHIYIAFAEMPSKWARGR